MPRPTGRPTNAEIAFLLHQLVAMRGLPAEHPDRAVWLARKTDLLDRLTKPRKAPEHTD